jgi:hypothetical protein
MLSGTLVKYDYYIDLLKATLDAFHYRSKNCYGVLKDFSCLSI